MLARLHPALVLLALTLIFFADLVLHPTNALYSDTSDLLAEHIPARRFLVRSWRETGELPLWCPYSFSGAPFVHDPQVQVFYPPQAVLFLLPEEAVGPALSWLIVAHVFLGGWGMYVYARRQELAVGPALIAAAGFMFAGKWMLHLLAAGHLITVGLAWLPWLLLVLEDALRTHRPRRAAAAGALFALLLLGAHPQWAFYAGLFVALWALGTVLDHMGLFTAEGPCCRRHLLTGLGRWAGYGLLTVAIGIGLAAVQLLPTAAAAGQATRGSGVGTDDVLAGGLRALLFFVGPALTEGPVCLTWEDRGGFGLLWVLAAVLAPLLVRGRARYQAGVMALLVAFSLGGAYLFQLLPGFNLFRQPTRMLLIVAFPVAYLAGVTTQALFAATAPSIDTWQRCRRVLVRLTIATLILAGGFAVRLVLSGEVPQPHIYWASLLVTVPATFWLFRKGRQVAWLWGLLLLVDLWALAWPLVQTRSDAEVYARSACLGVLGQPEPGTYRLLDRDAPHSSGTPLGAGAPLAMVHGFEAVRGYNPLDNRRTKEYYLAVAGEDRPLRPFRDPLTFPVIDNFPVVHKPLLDLLGVRYVLQPAHLAWAEPSLALSGPGWRRTFLDPAPAGYDFIGGGLRELPPYVLYENSEAFPRAFVVPEAGPLPHDNVTAALASTDFRRRVLLENGDGEGAAPPTGDDFHPAYLVSYRPNRVEVEAEGPGWLVLADIWYPGWGCCVDGNEAHLYRANALFRAVWLSPGRHTVVFAFAPTSYRWGGLITATTSAVLALVGLLPYLRRRFRRRLSGL